ncbi:MAG: hypothetical protein P8144_05530 [Gammaproteobacteria bacterium]
MNTLKNRSVKHSSPSHQAAPQGASRQRSLGLMARVEKIEVDCSIPRSALLRTSVAEDMSAASSWPRVNNILALEFNTGSWNKILDEWVNSVGLFDLHEKTNRKIARERISACIKENHESLELHGLKLSSLPPVLSYCKALRELNCGTNKLTQLNLEGCKTLRSLYCCDNKLTQLNLEGCKELEKLYCNKNRLTRLNLNGCEELEVLYCSKNRLTQLNLENSSAIRNICCSDNNKLKFDHPEFLMGMSILSHIECSNTAIEWDLLPAGIRNAPGIYIDIRPQRESNQALNNAQNTHVQSIHRCASQNALTLKSKYSTQNLEEAYLEFCKWIGQQPVDGADILDGYVNDDFKNLTAKQWIKDPQHLEERDGTSKVSVKEFIALAWLAAKDPTQREPHVLEISAKKVLVDALYEIRRGYNLDAAHVPKDNGGSDDNICASGTFNKISEKLVSVIQGMASYMVTAETFQLSLFSTIKKAVKDKRNENPSVDHELNENNNFLSANVWKKIKANVIASIKDEFKNHPKIAGKKLSQHIHEQTDYEQVLQYFSVS